MANERVVDTNEEITGNLYVEDETDVEDENAEAETSDDTEGQTEEDTSSKIPDKFKGKSLEDVVRSYTELEKSFGKQAHELGETRKLADQLVQRELETRTSSQKTENDSESEGEVEFDFDNPIESIRKLVKKELNPLNEKLTRTDALTARQQLMEKHPDANDIHADPDFQEWVNSSNVRKKLYRDADVNLDIEAADELLSTYKSLHPKQKEKTESELAAEKKQKKKQQEDRVNEMSTESGSTGQVTGRILKRKEIINLRANNPKKYWEMASEIQKAYKEGRVR